MIFMPQARWHVSRKCILWVVAHTVASACEYKTSLLCKQTEQSSTILARSTRLLSAVLLTTQYDQSLPQHKAKINNHRWKFNIYCIDIKLCMQAFGVAHFKDYILAGTQSLKMSKDRGVTKKTVTQTRLKTISKSCSKDECFAVLKSLLPSSSQEQPVSEVKLTAM